jgi:hypothetical protein
MFADIARFINLSNEKPTIFFGGTIIEDDPICDTDVDNRTDFSNCIDNWVIKGW